MARLYCVLIKLWEKIMDFVIFPQSFIVQNDFISRQIDEILIEMAEIEALILRQIDEKSLGLAEIRIIYNTEKQFIIQFYAAKSRSEFIQNFCMICM